ncbi:prostaglandin F2-alpha receptor isoform X2 [Paramormyrops kingsleyae]|uniref:prostaglandin F2-alpha receptor isoform X2 n=1 Tax=Paramormyrops kingsleyae TaxID=1676925 RepID=UPI003B9756E6
MLSNASALEDCAAPAPPNITCVRTDLSVMVSVVSMTVGMLSNTLALVILIKAYRRFRLKSKASFLLLASGLVVTNFLGHLINGCLALYVYSFCMDWKSIDPHNVLCSFFGASMVFFGLSPLLLGSGMAVERCLGVTRPIFHSVALTSRHTKQLLAALWFLAAVVAALPIMTRRPYRVQRSRSWCFFAEDGGHWLDLLLPLLFACVGLLALLVSVLCNTVTGLTLMRSRMLRQRQRRGPTAHHLEMICQLVAIMLVSCVCWGPILVSVVVRSTHTEGQQGCGRMLLAVRMATWNQILDPWVYILLRKAVLRKLFRVARSCCGTHLHILSSWNFSTIKGSMPTSTYQSSTPEGGQSGKVTVMEVTGTPPLCV